MAYIVIDLANGMEHSTNHEKMQCASCKESEEGQTMYPLGTQKICATCARKVAEANQVSLNVTLY